MPILLDTDHLSVLQLQEHPATLHLQARINPLPPQDIHVAIVSFQEQARGWLAYIHRARKPADVLRGFQFLQNMLADFSARNVLPFDQAAMSEFLNLKQQRIRIGTSDLRIAAIVKVNGLKLLSRNLRDFRQVPGLDVEDWTV